MTTPLEIRKRLLKQRGVELKRLTRKPIPIEEAPVPYPKSNLMKLVERTFRNKLENLIFTGTIYEVEKRLSTNGVHVDASTVSKWRKLIQEAKDREFFEQFGNT